MDGAAAGIAVDCVFSVIEGTVANFDGGNDDIGRKEGAEKEEEEEDEYAPVVFAAAVAVVLSAASGSVLIPGIAMFSMLFVWFACLCARMASAAVLDEADSTFVRRERDS